MTETRRSFDFPLSVSVRSDVGQVRANNEDSFGHAWLEDGSLFVIVADGMGGHEAGEVASNLAVRVLEDAVGRDPDADPRERIYHGLLEANRAIMDEGKRSGTRGMGTTAVAAILRGPEAYLGLIGDSRLYHVRRGQLVWRTLDHTRVQLLIDRGEITEEAGRVHPEAGILTRALGHSKMADGKPLVPDVLAEPLQLEPNDVLILCSDGLHDLVDDWEVAKMVAGKSADQASELLIKLANERGGHDNVTVAVVIAGSQAEPYDASYRPPQPERDAAAAAGGDADDLAAPAAAGGPVGTAGAVPTRPPPGVRASDVSGGRRIEPWMIAVAALGLIGFLVVMVLMGIGIGLFVMSR